MGPEAVVLVGHGGVPRDFPRALITELKRHEAARRSGGIDEPGARELEIDRHVRQWPRTPETDPYRVGLERLAEELRPRLGGRRLVAAYNEFCAPSIEDAIARLVAEGARRITLVTTMFTRGGSHAEVEIPEVVTRARARHPGVVIEYAWPFDLRLVAEFLAEHLGQHLHPRAPSAGQGVALSAATTSDGSG